MRVGILGSGLMGGKLGTIFARAGHGVVFSYARRHGKLKELARDARGNARAGTPREAAQEADALLLAVHWAGDLPPVYGKRREEIPSETARIAIPVQTTGFFEMKRGLRRRVGKPVGVRRPLTITLLRLGQA